MLWRIVTILLPAAAAGLCLLREMYGAAVCTALWGVILALLLLRRGRRTLSPASAPALVPTVAAATLGAIALVALWRTTTPFPFVSTVTEAGASSSLSLPALSALLLPALLLLPIVRLVGRRSTGERE